MGVSFKVCRDDPHMSPYYRIRFDVGGVHVKVDLYSQWREVLQWRRLSWANFDFLVVDYSAFEVCRQLSLGVLGLSLVLTLQSEGRQKETSPSRWWSSAGLKWQADQEVTHRGRWYGVKWWVDLLYPIRHWALFRDLSVVSVGLELSKYKYAGTSVEVFFHVPFFGVTFDTVPGATDEEGSDE